MAQVFLPATGEMAQIRQWRAKTLIPWKGRTIMTWLEGQVRQRKLERVGLQGETEWWGRDYQRRVQHLERSNPQISQKVAPLAVSGPCDNTHTHGIAQLCLYPWSWTAQKCLGMKICFLVIWPAFTSSQEFVSKSLLLHVHVATNKTIKECGTDMNRDDPVHCWSTSKITELAGQPGLLTGLPKKSPVAESDTPLILLCQKKQTATSKNKLFFQKWKKESLSAQKLLPFQLDTRAN